VHSVLALKLSMTVVAFQRPRRRSCGGLQLLDLRLRLGQPRLKGLPLCRGTGSHSFVCHRPSGLHGGFERNTNDASFAIALTAAMRATTKYISSWVFSVRSSPMVRAFLTLYPESVCSRQGINNYKACKKGKDKVKLPA
jgi:hypothetical protein